MGTRVLHGLKHLCHLQTYESYKSKYPEEAKELDSIITGKLPEGWADGEAAGTPCCGMAIPGA